MAIRSGVTPDSAKPIESSADSQQKKRAGTATNREMWEPAPQSKRKYGEGRPLESGGNVP